MFCDKVPEWQEHHMDSLLREYVALINSPGDASARFWELVEIIKKDKKNPRVQRGTARGCRKHLPCQNELLICGR